MNDETDPVEKMPNASVPERLMFCVVGLYSKIPALDVMLPERLNMNVSSIKPETSGNDGPPVITEPLTLNAIDPLSNAPRDAPYGVVLCRKLIGPRNPIKNGGLVVPLFANCANDSEKCVKM